MLYRLVLFILSLSFAVAAQSVQSKPPSSSTSSGEPSTQPGAAPNPVAVLHTTQGDMKCELFPKQAPNAVANFIGLSSGKKDWTDPATGKLQHHRPLYDGVIFHRVIPGFMIQSGDPMGMGIGNPGYRFNDELHADLLFDQPGRLAMANSGPNTNGSQFFITETPQPSLDPCLDSNGCQRGMRQVPKGTGYTIFGQCDNATVELVKQIALMPRDARNHPANPVKITHIDILNVSNAAPTKTATHGRSRTAKTSNPHK